MSRMRTTILLASLSLMAVTPAKGQSTEVKVPFEHKALARQELAEHIRPSYQRFLDSSRKMGGVLQDHCSGRSEKSRKTITDAFDDLISAWGRIEHILFGPVVQNQRFERIMFWPDRRGIGARQIAKALREGDATLLDVGSLAQKSVAVQGLPALEAVLFDGWAEDRKTSEPALKYRCGFAVTISENLANVAAEIVKEWSETGDFAKSWLDPGPGNPHYLKPEETTLAIAKSLDQGLEKVRDQFLGGPLGLNAQRRKLSPVFGRSGRTMRLIVAHIAGLRSLYGAGGLEKALVDAKGDDPINNVEFAHLVANEMAVAETGATALLAEKSPFEGPAASRIIALGFPLKNARSTAVGLLAAVTELPMGFNASDGD